MTGSQVAVIIIILAAGFSKAKPANLTPFLPFGVQGIFSGASFVFFRCACVQAGPERPMWTDLAETCMI